MLINDTLGDMLIRMKNAGLAARVDFEVPFSKEKENTLKVLQKNGYLVDYQIKQDGIKKTIKVKLQNEPKVRKISVKRISKPGRRVYIKAKNIYSVKGGRGILIISTPKGIMDSKEAVRQKLGGELMAEIFEI